MNATYVLSGRQFEDVFEKTYQRKVEKMQSVLQCCFEEIFDDTQWRKATQMQAKWLCILPCGRFEEIFKNAQWRKVT